jgi:NAD(P)-dependent dehydrogenase (short-subunit alcohol dehydrogenase family)
MKTDFAGQAAIVTGASAGIGRALALQLAARGARVALAARRAERLEEVAAVIRARGGEALPLPADVSDEAQCRALVEAAVGAFGRLDLLVNNAGMAASALFDEFPNLQLFRRTIDVNFYGAVYCTYYALPHLKQSGGRILVISSLGGRFPLPYNTPYIASKYALHGFCEALRLELAPTGVSVTLVCPYWVATEFHTAQLNKDGLPRGEARGKDLYTPKTMSAERCAAISLNAAASRRREVLMGPGPLAVWLKLLAPGLLDRAIVKFVMEPVVRRARAAAQAKP